VESCILEKKVWKRNALNESLFSLHLLNQKGSRSRNAQCYKCNPPAFLLQLNLMTAYLRLFADYYYEEERERRE